ncbi:Nibrin [Orchesella cincta]|uniref:Nibrin n=1 Tax=Orchesella cincta TaxID=48709 RepID=A0A1D2MQA3_ORCCI|nr:Nibrin [Orchesella cincta]
MLQLTSTKRPVEVSYPLLAGRAYIVGQKIGDITFPNDETIMRFHAELEVEHPLGNLVDPNLTPTLDVTDIGSNAGIFATEVNIRRKFAVAHSQKVTLSIGDLICFGTTTGENEFRVNYMSLVVVPSSSVDISLDFKNRIAQLGGYFMKKWNARATHLVMDEITLTVKVVAALLAAKPIVTPAYITELLVAYAKADNPERELPNPKNFLPPVAVYKIRDPSKKFNDAVFYPNTARTMLLIGKTFLFGSKQHLKSLKSAITAGGGNAQLLVDATEMNILSGDYIIMGHPKDIEKAEENPTVRILIDVYKSLNKRFVRDEELGWAALSSSIEKFCNPDFRNQNAQTVPNQYRMETIE